MDQVAPILFVIIFWAFAFIFAFWFSQRSMRPPTVTEEEYAHEQAEQAAHKEASASGTHAH